MAFAPESIEVLCLHPVLLLPMQVTYNEVAIPAVLQLQSIQQDQLCSVQQEAMLAAGGTAAGDTQDDPPFPADSTLPSRSPDCMNLVCPTNNDSACVSCASICIVSVQDAECDVPAKF